MTETKPEPPLLLQSVDVLEYSNHPDEIVLVLVTATSRSAFRVKRRNLSSLAHALLDHVATLPDKMN